jgi:hypothetical protein
MLYIHFRLVCTRLDDIFCWQEDRTLSNNLTLQYDKRMYLIEDTPETRVLKRKRVKVFDFANNEIKIKHEGKELPFGIHFDKLRSIEAGQIVDNKRLGNILRFVQEEQQKRDSRRSQSCPTRSLSGIKNIEKKKPADCRLRLVS